MEAKFPYRKSLLFVNITVFQGLKILEQRGGVASSVVLPVLYVDFHRLMSPLQ